MDPWDTLVQVSIPPLQCRPSSKLPRSWACGRSTWCGRGTMAWTRWRVSWRRWGQTTWSQSRNWGKPPFSGTRRSPGGRQIHATYYQVTQLIHLGAMSKNDVIIDPLPHVRTNFTQPALVRIWQTPSLLTLFVNAPLNNCHYIRHFLHVPGPPWPWTAWAAPARPRSRAAWPGAGCTSPTAEWAWSQSRQQPPPSSSKISRQESLCSIDDTGMRSGSYVAWTRRDTRWQD